MSAISLKSISGITSITTPAGVDNQFTLHNNNTTEAVKLDTAGNFHFHNHLNITGVSTASNFKTGTSNLHNTGLNVQDLDVDGHTNLDNVSIAGVTTSTGNIYADNYFANSGLTLNNNGNPSVNITSTSTTGSSRIHFGDPDSSVVGKIYYVHNGDYMHFNTAYGERLRIASDGVITAQKSATFGNTSDSFTAVNITSSTSGISELRFADTTANAGYLKYEHSTDDLIFATGGSGAEKLRIDSSGHAILKAANAAFKSESSSSGDWVRMYAGAGTGKWDIYGNGADLRFSDNDSAGSIRMDRPLSLPSSNIVMGSGYGIDFSATGDGGTASSELFDDYEEGSYIPTVSFSGTTYTYGASNDYVFRSPHSSSNNNSIAYTKIGSRVFLNFAIFWNSTITARYVITLPFTIRGSAYQLCTTPAFYRVEIGGDCLGTLGAGSAGFDTYRTTKDTSNAGHADVPITQHSEVYYMICYETTQ